MTEESKDSDDLVIGYQEEYENAGARLQEQRQTLENFSNEGLRVFRLSVLLVGVPVAVLGAIDSQSLGNTVELLYSTDCAVSSLSVCIADMKSILYLIVPAFLITVLLHIMSSGFEARGVHNQTNPDDIYKIRNHQLSEREYYKKKLSVYEGRIEDNDRVIFAIETFLGFGKFFFSVSVSGMFILTYVLAFGEPFEGLWILSVVLIILGASHVFPTSYHKADGGRPWNFTPPYPRGEERESPQRQTREE